MTNQPTPASPFLGAGEELVREHALAIVETVRESLLLLDADLRVVGANRSLYDLLGTPPEATLGRFLYDLEDGQWGAPELRRLLEDVLPHHSSFEDFEVGLVAPEIGRRVLLLNGRRLPTAAGGRPLILLAVSDVTAQKVAEERAVAHAAQLERSNRELQEFARVASHDLQEPLRKIQAFGSLLVKDHGGSLPAEARSYLDSMVNAAGRMRDLVNALLALARIATRGRPFEPVPLSQVVREVLGDLDRRIADTAATVDVGDLPVVYGDASQLRQLFQNLIGNALKFHAPDRAPTVRVWADAPPAVPAHSAVRVPFATLHVADEGIGFDEKYLDRMFQPFERLHPRQSYEGTGMGLAIGRRVVERHGGTLTGRSVPGSGAVFDFTLPLAALEGAHHGENP